MDIDNLTYTLSVTGIFLSGLYYILIIDTINDSPILFSSFFLLCILSFLGLLRYQFVLRDFIFEKTLGTFADMMLVVVPLVFATLMISLGTHTWSRIVGFLLGILWGFVITLGACGIFIDFFSILTQN